MTTGQFGRTSTAEASTELSYDDVVTLTAWMAAEGYTAGEVAYAVEKPWKHQDEIALARDAAIRDPS